MEPEAALEEAAQASRKPGRGIDERITAIASDQHGVVARGQLLAAGIPPNSIRARVQSRRLRPLYRGVYLIGSLVGPLVPARARQLAAVLACGPSSMISHESAASLWGIMAPPPDSAPVHVTIPGSNRGRREGIRPHRVASLAAEDTAKVEGVPATTPLRTIMDIAARIHPRQLEQAIARAERRQLTDLGKISSLLERRAPFRGARALRSVLGSGGNPALTRSEAEERLLALMKSGGLPLPECNTPLCGYEIDFLWRTERIAVEVDGFAYHSSRRTFELDRRRDARLAARGYQVVRVTWRQLVREPEAVLVRIAQVLARAQ